MPGRFKELNIYLSMLETFPTVNIVYFSGKKNNLREEKWETETFISNSMYFL